MPIFSYIVKDSTGHTKTDIVQSYSKEALVMKLQSEGLYVINVRLAMEKSALKIEKKAHTPKFDHDKVRIEDLLVLSRQLATMLQAGVTMLRSLDVILSQIQSRQLVLAVTKIHNDIEQGVSLSAALAKHPKVFNQFWVSLAEVGEASGTMPLVLNKLAGHVEQDAAFRSTIISAMVYPIILFVVCILAILFFALVVGPRFEDVFKSMHAELPLMTRCLLGTFAFLRHNILLIIVFSVGLFFVLKSYFSTPMGKLQFERIIYQLPVFGEITKLVVVERFAAQMAILIESGVPILYALEITEKLVENRTCSLVVSQVREGVREGKGISEVMMESTFFPVMAVQMIKVGEETGELAKMLKHVAEFYQENVAAFMKRFGTLIEPFMLVFMAVVIGIIVISIFLPLFKLGQGGHYQ
ncbi:MAG: type II secretion system F family protein [Candidatus Omnitrophica bacterium]|nr:type II secretion system F family protein [Candidatus Omnitrophota bacterium]